MTCYEYLRIGRMLDAIDNDTLVEYHKSRGRE